MFSVVAHGGTDVHANEPVASEQFALRSQSTPDSARTPSVVTFLFTDIQGSTRLLQDAGPDYAEYLAAHRRLLRSAFAANGGQEVDTQGDSFFVVFPTARSAVRASIDGQRALTRHPWPGGRAVRVRMGLHTGEATRVGEGFVGLEVHRAARIAAATHGGQVVLSETTAAFVRDALPGGAALRDLGEHRLKDFARPQRLFQVEVEGLPGDFPPLRTSSSSGLPVALGRFVGRQETVRSVVELLETDGVRLLTFTGPGGVGKTRLALEVAARLERKFEDGVVVVMLGSVTDPSLVLPAIRDTLGLHEDGREASATIATYLAQRHVLLVLDNFEQVIGAAADVGALVTSARRVTVLVTSREVLRISGEHEYEVSPLTVTVAPGGGGEAEAVELFVERARAARHDFALSDDNRPVVREICRRLDGMPLAIELAAAWVRLLPLETILAKLASRLTLLTGGPIDLPDRQRSLRNTIAWSYDLLEDDDRRLFERLGVFAGGWSLGAAEEVCGGEGVDDVFRGLVSLADKSFVHRRGVVGGEPRFAMLATLQEFAVVKLDERGDSGRVRNRHAEYFRRLAEEAGPRLRTGDQDRWWKRLSADGDNLRTATRWLLTQGHADSVARTGRDLWHFWWSRGQMTEASGWMEEVLAASEGVADEGQTLAHAVLGILAFGSGDFTRALPHLKRSEEICRRLGDSQGQAMAQALQGFILGIGGDASAGQAALAEALSLFSASGDTWGTVLVRYALGRVLLTQGRDGEAIGTLRQSVAGAREVGEALLLGMALLNLGWAQIGVADYIGATASLGESLDLVAGLSNAGEAPTLEALAAVAADVGEPEAGTRLLGAAQRVRRVRDAEVWVHDLSNLDRTEKALRGALSREAFDAHLAEGSKLSIEEVTDLAAELRTSVSSSHRVDVPPAQ